MKKHDDSYWHSLSARKGGMQIGGPSGTGRAVMPAGNRFRPYEQKVPVRNAFGKVVELTPMQHRIMLAVNGLEGQKVSATIIAASLGVAPSTVTRALLILAAWKLVAYDVETGRNGGFTFLAMAWADLKRRSATAWSRIKQAKDRAWDRYLAKLERSHYYTAGLNFATSTRIDATFSEAT